MAYKCQSLFMQLAEFKKCAVYEFYCLKVLDFKSFQSYITKIIYKWITNDLTGCVCDCI